MTRFKNRNLSPFGTSVFTEMTQLANEVGAINLAQGFPDFDGPEVLMTRVEEAMREGQNQYAPSSGHPLLKKAVSQHRLDTQGQVVCPESEVLITNGATEALSSCLLGVLNPGDEVILMEPFYDCYAPVCRMAGATAVFYTLRAPEFLIDRGRLEDLITPRTKVMVVNTPHNPTGRVFSSRELQILEELCDRHDLLLISDEVYEEILLDSHQHVSPSRLDRLASRTIAISSAGKTFSLTGWKVGWAVGPKPLIDAAESAHQYLTFSTARPLQLGVAEGLSLLPAGYREDLRRDYRERYALLAGALSRLGFSFRKPEGSYFILSKFDQVFDGSDVEFAQFMARDVGVAIVPTSSFYENEKQEGETLVRFSFCKKLETLQSAIDRLEALSR